MPFSCNWLSLSWPLVRATTTPIPPPLRPTASGGLLAVMCLLECKTSAVGAGGGIGQGGHDLQGPPGTSRDLQGCCASFRPPSAFPGLPRLIKLTVRSRCTQKGVSTALLRAPWHGGALDSGAPGFGLLKAALIISKVSGEGGWRAVESGRPGARPPSARRPPVWSAENAGPLGRVSSGVWERRTLPNWLPSPASCHALPRWAAEIHRQPRGYRHSPLCVRSTGALWAGRGNALGNAARGPAAGHAAAAGTSLCQEGRGWTGCQGMTQPGAPPSSVGVRECMRARCLICHGLQSISCLHFLGLSAGLRVCVSMIHAEKQTVNTNKQQARQLLRAASERSPSIAGSASPPSVLYPIVIFNVVKPPKPDV